MEGDDRIWFITGSSSGFGRALAETVLQSGGRVAAAARDPEAVGDLMKACPQRCLALRLDVTVPEEVRSSLKKASEFFGRIDVVVNNAGYGAVGAIEEISRESLRRQFDVNFFGALDVIRAALPILRAQGSGHILNISSVAGFRAFGGSGIYSASKFALEAISEALAREVASLGIRVTIVEPGPFRTDFNGRSLDRPSDPMPEYRESAGKFLQWLAEMDGRQPGDPRKAALAMMRVVQAENPPLRLVLGRRAVDGVRAKLRSVSEEVDAWESVSLDTEFD